MKVTKFCGPLTAYTGNSYLITHAGLQSVRVVKRSSNRSDRCIIVGVVLNRYDGFKTGRVCNRALTYICRARSREHYNTMQKLILNYTRLHEHTHLIHLHER